MGTKGLSVSQLVNFQLLAFVTLNLQLLGYFGAAAAHCGLGRSLNLSFRGSRSVHFGTIIKTLITWSPEISHMPIRIFTDVRMPSSTLEGSPYCTQGWGRGAPVPFWWDSLRNTKWALW